LQAEPAFDSPAAVQPPPNPIRLYLFITSAQRGFAPAHLSYPYLTSSSLAFSSLASHTPIARHALEK